jgi:hypothetical protein
MKMKKTENDIKVGKIKRFHALLYQTHMLDSKQDFLESYNVSSTSHLAIDELDELIAILEGIQSEKEAAKATEVRLWRHKCLRMISLCGVNTSDWNKVNAFMLKPQISGKHLYSHTVPELQLLHRKLHNVASEKAKRRNHELLKASMN